LIKIFSFKKKAAAVFTAAFYFMVSRKTDVGSKITIRQQAHIIIVRTCE